MPTTKKPKPTYQPVLTLPPLPHEEFLALRDNIAVNGVLVPILVDENRRIIDGQYRKHIADELGYECPEIVQTGLTEEEKRTLARALNLARRQLTTAAKRQLIADQLVETPGRSNRWVGKQLGVSHPTVASVRAELEATGKVYQFEWTVGEDGRRRKAGGFAGHERQGMTNDWLTPRYILDALGPFDLDPCSCLGQPWPTAKRHLTVQDDGLWTTWRGRVWLNPPYADRTHLRLARMAAHRNGIALLYARTETQMFFDHVWAVANGIFFFKGRVCFCRADGKPAAEVAGAPSVLVSYDAGASRRNYARLKACGLEGKFLTIR